MDCSSIRTGGPGDRERARALAALTIEGGEGRGAADETPPAKKSVSVFTVLIYHDAASKPKRAGP
jgi:hypothetical protein